MADTQAVKERQVSIFTYMSGTGRRLVRWEKVGLINRDQMFSILDYEKDHNGKRLIRNLVALALFAIGVGILSIIAANWMHIPGGMKIGIHLLLNIIAATHIFKYDRQGKTIWREGASLIFFALNLTLIILIGQVFQMGGDITGALALWMLISTPALMYYGRTAINAVPWTMALLATVFSILVDSSEEWRGDDLPVFLLWLGACLYVPLAMMAAGASRFIRSRREDLAHTLYRMAMMIFAIGATCGSFLWYSEIGRDLVDVFSNSEVGYATAYAMMAGIIAIAIAAVYIFDMVKRRGGEQIADRSGILFVVISIASAVMPILLMAGDVPFIAALHFIAYWVFAGWIGYRLGYTQLMNAAVTLVTLRIIAVYFELFGGLMLTGFGLIGGGVLTLVTLKAALNFREKLVQTASKEVA